MPVEILGDRFLRGADGRWLDLATGEPAFVPVLERDRAGAGPDVDADSGGEDEAVRALAEHVGAVAAGSGAGVRMVRAVPAPRMSEIALGRAIARRLRRLGFVCVRAGLDLPSGLLTALGRRHVAVLCYDAAGDAAATAWIRRLAIGTLRGHLVVDLRAPGDRSRCLADAVRLSPRTRERAPVYAASGVTPASQRRFSDARIQRATACLRHDRGAAGERWLRAAVEGSRRRGDEAAEAEAARRLLERLMTRDDWDGARRLVLDLFGRLRGWHVRAHIADLGGRVLVAVGDLARADGLLAAVGAEALVLGQAFPPEIRLRQAQVRFWQGRFEEASHLVGGVDDAVPGGAAWRRLVAWACGDVAGTDEASPVPFPADAIRSAEGTTERLARACAAEELLSQGRPADALRRIGPRPARPVPARLDAALLDWMRSRCVNDPASAGAAEDFIRRSNARGITRWGLGRTGMHLLHAVPALLHIVHDAEDDLAVLTRGCSWIRTHAGADAAGIVTHDGGRVVVGDGLTAASLDEDLVRDALRSERPRAVARGADVVVTAPVHCAGTAIGLVVARGPSGAAATLADAAAAVSSLCAPALRARLDGLAHLAAGRSLTPEILGISPAVQSLRDAIARAAATAFPVLIEGESGTGKELVARAVHRLSARRDRRFCAINCAALSDELVEAELFGHTRGAFTGAVGARTGLFEEAHAGTLFLDEVGELSARAQAKLLRVLQEREIRRVGENASRQIDVRVVAATNRPLNLSAAGGMFREDLRFRLAVVRFRLPALRERLEDVPLLAEAFWRRMTAETGKRVLLGPDAIAALCRHSWPGNVRELQNAVAALVVLAPARGRVSARHVAEVLAGEAGAAEGAVLPLDTARRTFERQVVTAALARHAGRRVDAARELGLSRQGLTKAIKRLGVVAGSGAEGVA